MTTLILDDLPLDSPTLFHRPGQQWLHPVQWSAGTIASRAAAPRTIMSVVDVLKRLEPDDYLRFMLDYYQAGLSRFGDSWGYIDLLTVLHAIAELSRPRRYLEIGVRRGRSLAVVASAVPDCAIVGFDLWLPNYAGMSNPGPDFVRGELRAVGHRGPLELVSGDSRKTVPAYFAQQPDLLFDAINVDGDHSEEGARTDMATVLPRLRVGGVVVLDDIAHPQHRYLECVWDELVGGQHQFSSFKYRDLGYGVAVAVRKE